MADELDEILIEQLLSAKKRRRLIKNYKRLFRKEKILDEMADSTNKMIQFYESMIRDKSSIPKYGITRIFYIRKPFVNMVKRVSVVYRIVIIFFQRPKKDKNGI